MPYLCPTPPGEKCGLGWVDTRWREMGIPFWLSLAFWQWLAIGFLWLGLGLLWFTQQNKYDRPDT